MEDRVEFGRDFRRSKQVGSGTWYKQKGRSVRRAGGLRLRNRPGEREKESCAKPKEIHFSRPFSVPAALIQPYLSCRVHVAYACFQFALLT